MAKCEHKRRLAIVDGGGLGVFYETRGSRSRIANGTCRPWVAKPRHAFWCYDCGCMSLERGCWRVPKLQRPEPLKDGLAEEDQQKREEREER